MRTRDDVCCLPRGLASAEFEKAYEMPGPFKSALYLLLAGLCRKLFLKDFFHLDVQEVVFGYLDLLGFHL